MMYRLVQTILHVMWADAGKDKVLACSRVSGLADLDKGCRVGFDVRPLTSGQ